MEERIQKLFSGICSRRAAEAYISAGRVTVNGIPAVLGQRADPERDVVLLDGQPLPRPAETPVCLLLNKPRGYVTTLSDERGRPTVADLVRGCGVRVYPVGRLDMDSEGLLLLTNDGELAQRLAHPRGGTEKTYHVTVSLEREEGRQENRRENGREGWQENQRKTRQIGTGGIMRGVTSGGDTLEQAAQRLSAVTNLDGEPILPARVEVLSRSRGRLRLSVTIREGKNRQIRRMCTQCGLRVLRLRRVREHTIELGNLPPGQWRYLTEAELSALRN